MPRRSAADQQIRKYLARHHLAEQARIPPERELAVTLGLSRAQLRTGLAKLKAEGVLWGRVGKGTFVGQEPAVDPRGLLQLTLLTNPRDVMEARLAIEPTLASLAAHRASLSECAHMEKCIARTRAASDRTAFQRWDDEWHQTVARAARNPLLLALYDAVNESRRREAWSSKRNRPLPAARRQAYIAQHTACLEAIKNRDADLAAAVMRGHLEFVARACDVFGPGSSELAPSESRRPGTLPGADAVLKTLSAVA